MMVNKDEKVVSSCGRYTGRTTGSVHHCQLEGCRGVRVTVKWNTGKVTHPCSKGMVRDEDTHTWRII
jgi:hypothetical protein